MTQHFADEERVTRRFAMHDRRELQPRRIEIVATHPNEQITNRVVTQTEHRETGRRRHPTEIGEHR